MSDAVRQLQVAEFQQVVLQASEPVIVDFWAPWCGPCRMLAPELEKAAQRLTGKATVVKVNIDENPSLATRFGVMSIPTILIMHRGQEIGRHVGFIGADALNKSIEEYLAIPV